MHVHATLSLILTGEQGAHILFTSQREKERGGEREREREKEGGREGERGEGIFLKGMTGALAPFSYLVVEINLFKVLKLFFLYIETEVIDFFHLNLTQ
jgi:hypothetical protein